MASKKMGGGLKQKPKSGKVGGISTMFGNRIAPSVGKK